MAFLYQLAQVNIGRIRADLDDPIMKGFVSRLQEINTLADNAPGFVWRLQDASGSATYVRPYDDERLLMNMSVWTTLEALKDYVYRSSHVELLRNRKDWFDPYPGIYAALWWVPAGHLPSMDNAKDRLEHLSQHGPTAYAFTMTKAFPPDNCCRN